MHVVPVRRRVGGLLLPGAPRTALIAYAATASAMLSLALVEWPDDGGTMPGKRWVFTTRVEPVSPPHPAQRGQLVEAPGTAPGSTTLIPRTVYRHSRQTGRGNIVRSEADWKGAEPALNDTAPGRHGPRPRPPTRKSGTMGRSRGRCSVPADLAAGGN